MSPAPPLLLLYLWGHLYLSVVGVTELQVPKLFLKPLVSSAVAVSGTSRRLLLPAAVDTRVLGVEHHWGREWGAQSWGLLFFLETLAWGATAIIGALDQRFSTTLLFTPPPWSTIHPPSDALMYRSLRCYVVLCKGSYFGLWMYYLLQLKKKRQRKWIMPPWYWHHTLYFILLHTFSI